MAAVFSVEHDIKGAAYKKFVREALARFALFSLVWRDCFDFQVSASDIRRDLRRFEVGTRRCNVWPANKVFSRSAVATIVYYRCDAGAEKVLLRPKSLFNWLSPKFPEDLAFYHKDKRCAVASVAHEQGAWIMDDDFVKNIQRTLKGRFEKPFADYYLLDRPVRFSKRS